MEPTLIEQIARAWQLPRPILPSEWAEQHRRMGRDSFVSRWSFEVAPYTRYPMDLAADPFVEWVVLCWAARTGKTQAVNNVIGWIIDRKPGNILYVRENNRAIEEYVEDRFRNFIDENPAVKQHMIGAWKTTANYVRFDRLTFYKAGAESPSGVVSRDVKYAFGDEIDLWPDRVDRIKTSPIAEVWGRTKSFSGRGRKFYAFCTPTSADRGIWKMLRQCGRVERWHAPCPHCGAWQPWGFGNLKWEPRPDDRSYEQWAQHIENTRHAWMVCAHCGGDVDGPDHPRAIDERARQIMMGHGQWVPEGSSVDPATGELWPPRTRERRVAFNLPAICSLLPGNAIHELAAEWLRACHEGPAAKTRCTNSVWAQPVETHRTSTQADTIRAKRGNHRLGECPDEAACITIGIDTQDAGLYYVIRAWGGNQTSWLLGTDYLESVEGLASDFKQLEGVLQKRFVTTSGRSMGITLGCIDSGGTRTHQVYSWAQEWNKLNPRQRVLPIKGQSGRKSGRLWFRGTPGGKTTVKRRAYMGNLELIMLYVWGYQDLLQSMLDSEPGGWRVAADTPAWYYQHLANMQRESDGSWVPVYEGAPEHARDCEVYALAAADLHDMQPLALKTSDVERLRANVKQPVRPAIRPYQRRILTPSRRY